MQSPKVEANQRAETYKQLWNFPNTYTLGKHMSEQVTQEGCRPEGSTSLSLCVWLSFQTPPNLKQASQPSVYASTAVTQPPSSSTAS